MQRDFSQGATYLLLRRPHRTVPGDPSVAPETPRAHAGRGGRAVRVALSRQREGRTLSRGWRQSGGQVD